MPTKPQPTRSAQPIAHSAAVRLDILWAGAADGTEKSYISTQGAVKTNKLSNSITVAVCPEGKVGNVEPRVRCGGPVSDAHASGRVTTARVPALTPYFSSAPRSRITERPGRVPWSSS